MIGLALGSFLNVVIFRFRDGKSVFTGRSQCLKCFSTIRWFDLVPVISYFFLKGRCRNCKEKISPLYPVVELVTAVVLFTLFWGAQETSLFLLLKAAMVATFIVVLFMDMVHFIIPDKSVLLLASLTVILKLSTSQKAFLNPLIFALVLTSFFAIIFLVSKGRWIGFGDIKLIFVIGFLFGYPLGYLAIVVAVWIAFIFSIILLAAGKANMKTEIPFGSFLSASAIFFIIFGNELQKITQYFY